MAAAKSAPASGWKADPRQALAVGPDFKLHDFHRDATPAWEGDKKLAEKVRAQRGELLSELQERLYAERTRSLLVVVQGLDTAGKGGIARHVMSAVDPQGVRIKAFKKPTAEELSHHFLWRIRAALPQPGYIGVFDRSHYEDVLVPAANDSLSAEELSERYAQIAEFEKELVANGTSIVKFCLLVSYEEQGLRLRERIDRPDKRWKYSPHDLDVRAQWDRYQDVYEQMLVRSSTPTAPWYVIPADRKWYARLATTEVITRVLAELDPRWPEPDFDPAVERARLDATLAPDVLARYRHELGAKLAEVAHEDAQLAQQVAGLDANQHPAPSRSQKG